MSTPTASPDEQNQPQTSGQQPATAPGETPKTTQTTLTDGDGIRGGYGDSDQTNGLEGGPDSGPDGSPKHSS